MLRTQQHGLDGIFYVFIQSNIMQQTIPQDLLSLCSVLAVNKYFLHHVIYDSAHNHFNAMSAALHRGYYCHYSEEKYLGNVFIVICVYDYMLIQEHFFFLHS
jgi:hypothetical protein